VKCSNNDLSSVVVQQCYRNGPLLLLLYNNALSYSGCLPPRKNVTDRDRPIMTLYTHTRARKTFKKPKYIKLAFEIQYYWYMKWITKVQITLSATSAVPEALFKNLNLLNL
jgi:hypothetical protein